MPKVRVLSAEDVKSLLSMGEAIEVLEKAFSELSEGNAVMPQRTPIRNESAKGVALFMPAYIPNLSALGIKVVTVYNENPTKHNLPAVLGTIILLDPETGMPLSFMDAGYLTAMRTGAVSGLATKYLARENSEVHALLGTGVQARTQAWAVATVRKITKCLVYSIDPEEKKRKFCEEVQKLTGVETLVAEDARSAVSSADIVTLATSASSPIIDGDWVRPGTHINGIGSHAPTMREIDTKTVIKSKIFCDHIPACQAEAGDFIIPVQEGAFSWEKVHGELGELVNGKIKGRESEDEITLFKSVGLAIQDISTANFVFNKALEKNIGTDIEI